MHMIVNVITSFPQPLMLLDLLDNHLFFRIYSILTILSTFKQSMLLFDALNKEASLLSLEPIPLVTPDPRTQELINEKLNKAEELGKLVIYC